ncbi:molybdenum cofactor guanylyltransferase [Chryseobacterium sp.]|uniref:molybdenum cofactor guanylyltransferase n=1 Tax=Chryseobacterium sp. TaxID=1871047 RepID=UPI0025C2F673|nr:molybdenum cofactor guanylyltransferase [Chryseobacterium sp.]
MKAIVLAGGNSSRMGQNKALMKLGNQPVIQYAIDNLSRVFDEVYISGSSLEYPFFKNIIEDSVQSRGPIGGIYSALEYCREDIFVCSCDMPFISVKLIEDILSKKAEERINVLRYGDKIYPTLGIYPYSAIEVIKQSIERGHLKMTALLELQNANYIHYKDNLDDQLMNLNTPENFHHAELYINRKSI